MLTVQGPEGSTATFNDATRTHRYELTWPTNDPLGDLVVAWIMCNPSDADENRLDDTASRCRAFSRRWHGNRVLIANLFTLKSPRPQDLVVGPNRLRPDAIDPIGMRGQNDSIIIQTVRTADVIVCAWGNHGGLGDRARWVRKLIAEHVVQVEGAKQAARVIHLGMTKEGYPTHPLARGKHRVPDDVEPVDWNCTP